MAIPLRRGFDIGPRLHRLTSFAEPVMRVADDIRKCVVFLGHADGLKFTSCGTAFFFAYKKHLYIITARHIAQTFGDDPFALRVNRPDGTAGIFNHDPTQDREGKFRWFTSEDPTVDLAVMPFQIDLRQHGYDLLYLDGGTWTLTDQERDREGIGCGHFCYAIGLFRFVEGKRQNVPVLHTGHVALMPSPDERIPVEDWTDKTKITEVEGYLVEMTNLDGLSGSPVFIRPEIDIVDVPLEDRMTSVTVVQRHLYLMGVWQGSWEGDPTPALQRRSSQRVPVGMGIVVPSYKLIEILERPDVVAARERSIAHAGASIAAKSDRGSQSA